MKYLSVLMNLVLFSFVSLAWSQAGQEQVKAEEAKKICAGVIRHNLMEDCLREATEWLQDKQSKALLEEPFPSCKLSQGMAAARNILDLVYGYEVEDHIVYALYLNKCSLEDWDRDSACRMSQSISDVSNRYYTARNALESGESTNKSEVEEIKRYYFAVLNDFYILYEKRAALIVSDFQSVFQEIYKSYTKVIDSTSDTSHKLKEAFENTNDKIRSVNESHDSIDIVVIDPSSIIENIEKDQRRAALFPLYEKFHEIYAKHYLKCAE